jgi:iron(III) transport system ATP-binding protein
MTAIELQHIRKTFGPTVALDDISLKIPSGELLFLLGPSGCGKSTLLRIVAGLLDPSGGKILFDGRDVTNLSTEQRNAVMCFQNYALWPHMTVQQNVAFGLAMRGGAESANTAAALDALKTVQLDRYADRKPNALSGGQQQRAALARALVVKPQCLLLDEPLSNLDAKLRTEMRGEIRRLCKSGGFTTLYVTHDQKEALSIADRIVLLKDGKIAQIGSPAELYHHPRSSFVADFIGQTNLLPGRATTAEANLRCVETEIGSILAAANSSAANSSQSQSEKVVLSIRPEKIRIRPTGIPLQSTQNLLAGKVLENVFLGESSEHLVQVAGRSVRITSSPPIEPSGEVWLEIHPDDCIILPE